MLLKLQCGTEEPIEMQILIMLRLLISIYTLSSKALDPEILNKNT